MNMNNLTDEMKIACCRTCLLSEAMKDCNSCAFSIGLLFKSLDKVKTIEVEYPVELKDATLAKLTELIAL